LPISSRPGDHHPSHKEPAMSLPDTGSLKGDLAALIKSPTAAPP
jgi:hypothetical protein